MSEGADIVAIVKEGGTAYAEPRGMVRSLARQVDAGLIPGAVITRQAIEDGFADVAEIRADSLWERHPVTADWLRWPAAFFAARAESEAALPAQKETAQIALGVAMLELDRELPPQEDGPRYPSFRCGDSYIVYKSILSHDEGCYSPHQTSAAAIQEWKRRLRQYVATHAGDRFWWRCRPEIDAVIPTGDMTAKWTVYSRMATGSGETEVEQIRSGNLAPTRLMVDDGIVSRDEVERLGWRYDPETDGYRRGEELI